jgi:hypothetical protein
MLRRFIQNDFGMSVKRKAKRHREAVSNVSTLFDECLSRVIRDSTSSFCSNSSARFSSHASRVSCRKQTRSYRGKKWVRHDNGGESRIFEGDQLRRTADVTKNNGRCRRNVHSRKQMRYFTEYLRMNEPRNVRSRAFHFWMFALFAPFLKKIPHIYNNYRTSTRELC